MLLNSEIIVKNVTEDKTVFNFKFDLMEIPEDELLYMLRQFREVKKTIKCRSRDIDVVKSFIKESNNILKRGYKGDKGSMLNIFLLDPAMRGILSRVVSDSSVKDIGMWWCDAGSTGKYFTDILEADPYLNALRHAVALNPWSLDSLGDLDTIIDSQGYHKEGTIGKQTFSIEIIKAPTESKIVCSFYGASNTTIRSVIHLEGTNISPKQDTSSGRSAPSPLGTCSDSYYCSIYLPIWGFNVNASIETDLQYSVVIRYYI